MNSKWDAFSRNNSHQQHTACTLLEQTEYAPLGLIPNQKLLPAEVKTFFILLWVKKQNSLKGDISKDTKMIANLWSPVTTSRGKVNTEITKRPRVCLKIKNLFYNLIKQLYIKHKRWSIYFVYKHSRTFPSAKSHVLPYIKLTCAHCA